MKLAEGERLAALMVKTIMQTKNPPSRTLVVGSIRRHLPIVSDVDIVAEVTPEQREAVFQVFDFNPHAVIEAQGEHLLRLYFKGATEVAAGLVDVYFARPRSKDRPGNWGSVALCRTGSREHNIMIAGLAKSLGRAWNLQEGITKGGQYLAGETEEGMFEALGMEWVKPEARK